MAETAELLITVDSKGMLKVTRGLDKLSKASKAAEKQSIKSAKAYSEGTKAIAGFGAATLLTTAALFKFVASTAKANKEMGIFASQAGVSVEEFKALAFAARRYGIEGDKVADISKDISDRLGDFAVTGGGVFQDVIDSLRLTKEEAIAYNKVLSELKPIEAMGRIISDMEKAGATTEDLVFITESLAGESSRLLPLLKNNGKELSILADQYNKVSIGIKGANFDDSGLVRSSEQMEIMGVAATEAALVIANQLAPAFKTLSFYILGNLKAAAQLSQLLFDVETNAQKMTRKIDEGVSEQFDIVKKLEDQWLSLSQSILKAEAAGEDVTVKTRELKALGNELTNNAKLYDKLKAAQKEGKTVDKKEKDDNSAERRIGIANKLAAKEASIKRKALESQLQIEADASQGVLDLLSRLGDTKIGQIEHQSKREIEAIEKQYSETIINTQERDDAIYAITKKSQDDILELKKAGAQQVSDLILENSGTRLEKIAAEAQKEKELYDELHKQEIIDYEQLTLAKASIDENASEERAAFITESQRMILGGAASTFGALTELAGSYGKTQSKTYRALFAASKGFAAAEAVVKLQQGLAASAQLGFPAGLVAMGGFIASTAGILASINNANFSGRMNGGDVNGGQPYVVGERGPELIVPRGAASVVPKLKEPSQGPEASTQGGQGVTIVNQLDPATFGEFLNTEQGQKTLVNAIGENQAQIKTIIN